MTLLEAEWLEWPPGARRERGGEPAIDHAHLDRMTFGDGGLQREVLQLFIRQSSMLVGRMDAGRPAVVAALAHTLAGSAAAIGARALARNAARVEAAAGTAPEELADALAALHGSLEATSSAILDHLRSC